MEQETVERDARKWAAYAGYFASGALIGSVLGVLFAPKAGRETREDLNAWLEDKRKKSRAEYRAMRAALEKGARTVRARARELARA